MKENELISIIQNPPVQQPVVPPEDRAAGQGQNGPMTEDSCRELMERLHADNVCYTGSFSSFRAKC